MTITEYNARLDENRLPIIAETRTKYRIDGRKAYTSPDALYKLAANSIGLEYAAEEYAYCIAFDAKLRIIGVFECGHGCIDASVFDVRGMMQKSLFLGAHSVAIAHNHPSGDPTPSGADIAVTKRVKAAADVLGLRLIDHIIVGDRTYYSFHESREEIWK